MSIFSADEDFELNTLNAVPGLWNKLRYVSTLRKPDGEYEHWGLMRKFGREAAGKAIYQAHHELVLRILRMPVEKLVDETRETAALAEAPLRDFVARLLADQETLLPKSIRGGSARHFRTVVTSLVYLAQACTDANRQAS